MAEETLGLRYATLAISEADVTAYKMKVEIDVNTTLPFLDIPTVILDNTTIKFDEAITTTPANTAVLNVLTDLDDANRYVFIGKATSYTSGTIIDIYYDSKYKDILIIPALDALGDVATATALENATIPISGYRVGGLEVKGMSSYNMTMTTNQTTSFHVPECKRLAETKSVMLTLAGFDSASIYNGVEDNRTGPFNVTRGKVLPTQYISLGAASALFTTPTEKVSTYRVIPASIASYSARHVGRINAAEIFIPLNF